MKRSELPKRKTPLARTQLKPPTLAQVQAFQRKPRKPMPRESAKHRGQRPTRAKVVAFVRARDKTCTAVGLAPGACSGPLDVHEVIPRSAWALGYLEPDNCRLVCRSHHRWIDAEPDLAREVGLHGLASDRPKR